ncbi:MAG: hypothetical protein J5849_07780 [Clostridia bacterium]|nr:hypothetical protein [Clostridia bacterium]
MRKALPGIAALIAAAGLDLAGLFRTLVLFPSLPDTLPGNGVGKPMLLYLPSLAILLWIALFLASLRARRLEMKLPLPSAALPEAREALAEFLRILSLVSAGGFFYAVLRLSGGKTISPLAYVLLLLGLFLAAGLFLFRLIRAAKRRGVLPDEPDDEEGRKIVEDFMKEFQDPKA